MKNVRIGGLTVGNDQPLALIAGPCVIESREMAFDLAARLAALAKKENIPFVFKASYDKANRTSVRAFRGPGLVAGLEILAGIMAPDSVMGIDKEWPARFLIPLMEAHPGMRVVLSSDCVDDCRACKDAEEQALMRTASRINDAVNEAAKLAAGGRLDHRIGLTGPHDEITELAQTFDQMLENLERSTAAQRRFTANASHELRTPLATTRAILDVQLSKPGAVDREVLHKLQRVNERSIRTVESLLDLAELEADRVEPTECDLSSTVAAVLRDCRAQFAERKLTVESTLAPATAFGDERLFHQLAQNLIQNAIQHNIDGGSVTVSTRMRDGGTRAELTVRNTGAVVDAAQLGQLTEPFNTQKGRTGGTNRGLGLSIVSAIVERSNGSLDLSANDGGGLRITVMLPSQVPAI